MKIILVVLAFVAVGWYIEPRIDPEPNPQPVQPVIVMGGDVMMGIGLPRFGVTCGVTTVHGSPREDAPVIYTLDAGTTVRLRGLKSFTAMGSPQAAR